MSKSKQKANGSVPSVAAAPEGEERSEALDDAQASGADVADAPEAEPVDDDGLGIQTFGDGGELDELDEPFVPPQVVTTKRLPETPPPEVPRGSVRSRRPADEDDDEDDLVLLEVVHGEINSRDGLKGKGDVFRAPRKDAGWMIGTGNIKLVLR